MRVRAWLRRHRPLPRRAVIRRLREAQWRYREIHYLAHMREGVRDYGHLGNR